MNFLPRFWPNRQSDFRIIFACSRLDSFGDVPLKSPFINLSSPFSNFAVRCASCDLFYQRVVTILLTRFGIIIELDHFFNFFRVENFIIVRFLFIQSFYLYWSDLSEPISQLQISLFAFLSSPQRLHVFFINVLILSVLVSINYSFSKSAALLCISHLSKGTRIKEYRRLFKISSRLGHRCPR
jgi:hypothetical protein